MKLGELKAGITKSVKIGKLCRLELSLAGCGGSVGDVCDPWLRAPESFVFPANWALAVVFT